MILIIARAISFLANPLFILFPVPYLLILKTNHNTLYALKWSLFSLFFIGITGLFTLLEVKRGVFTDLDVSRREQRPLLFLFVGIVATVYLISLILLKGPAVLFLTIFGLMIGIILLSVINTRIKASIHVATITCVLLTLGILYNTHFLSMLLIPLIAWARIKTRRHTVSEALVGGALGAFLTLFMYIVIRYIMQYQE